MVDRRLSLCDGLSDGGERSSDCQPYLAACLIGLCIERPRSAGIVNPRNKIEDGGLLLPGDRFGPSAYLVCPKQPKMDTEIGQIRDVLIALEDSNRYSAVISCPH